MRIARALYAMTALFVVWSAGALARPVVNLHLSGALVQQTHGHVRLKSITGITLRRGDRVRYEIDAANTGDKAAFGFSALGPIPKSMRYVPASAHASQPTRIEYSLDGKSWSPRPMRVVKTARGTARIPAPPDTYVSVRFTALKALPPKSRYHYSYEVIVR